MASDASDFVSYTCEFVSDLVEEWTGDFVAMLMSQGLLSEFMAALLCFGKDVWERDINVLLPSLFTLYGTLAQTAFEPAIDVFRKCET